MLLKTQRLTIRPIVPEDWQSVRRIWLDFHHSPYAQYDTPLNTDEEDVRRRIARWAEASHGTAHMFFAVCLQEEMIGYIVFHIRPDSHEIGYCFHSAAHGHGYASESHRALLEHLRTLGITRFTVRTALANTPSVTLLQSLGFVQTGTETVSFYQDAQGNAISFTGGIFLLDTAQ